MGLDGRDYSVRSAVMDMGTLTLAPCATVSNNPLPKVKRIKLKKRKA